MFYNEDPDGAEMFSVTVIAKQETLNEKLM